LGTRKALCTRKDVVFLVALIAVGIWSYWPTIASLVERWTNVPDYSHGFLVVPFAVILLVLRRDTRPDLLADGRVWGIVLIGFSVVLRIASARMFLPSLDGWTIPIWLAGVALWAGGWRVLLWCAPALAFMWFMVPLPFRAESMMSAPLRDIAANSSVYLLHCVGQPAFAEGTSIILDNKQFDVAKQCSGLRMLMSVIALSFGYITLTPMPWWKKLILALAAVPVAVSANVLRVAATALLLQSIDSPRVGDFVHDAAGWLTIIIGGALFLLIAWCLDRMFIEVELDEAHPLMRVSRPV
jgi:exosortase